ncbi:hypothetical protein D3C78_1910550 [compost metagenome]
MVILIPKRAKGSCNDIVPFKITRGLVVTPSDISPTCPNNCGVFSNVIGIAIEFA